MSAGLRNFITAAAVAVLVLAPSHQARADFVLLDHVDLGPQTLLRDTDTGLAWLRFTGGPFGTVNRATNLSLVDATLGAIGMRFATAAEIRTLWDHGGVAPNGQYFDLATTQSHILDMLPFIELLGVPTTPVCVAGFCASAFQVTAFEAPLVAGSGVVSRIFAQPDDLEITQSAPRAEGQAWAVVEYPVFIVPEPSSLLLVTAGLGLLGFISFRRNTRNRGQSPNS